MGKLLKIKGPKIRFTSKGIKVSKPTARIGGKAGINFSTKGVSASVRTKAGTASTRRGVSFNFFGLFSSLFGKKKK